MFLLALTWGHYFFAISLTLLSLFMVLVILVQRGCGCKPFFCGLRGDRVGRGRLRAFERTLWSLRVLWLARDLCISEDAGPGSGKAEEAHRHHFEFAYEHGFQHSLKKNRNGRSKTRGAHGLMGGK